jgi:hypothetical protein
MHFYMVFSKELIRREDLKQEESQQLMVVLKKTLSNIRDEDIEVYLHYCPEVAV